MTLTRSHGIPILIRARPGPGGHWHRDWQVVHWQMDSTGRWPSESPRVYRDRDIRVRPAPIGPLQTFPNILVPVTILFRHVIYLVCGTCIAGRGYPGPVATTILVENESVQEISIIISIKKSLL